MLNESSIKHYYRKEIKNFMIDDSIFPDANFRKYVSSLLQEQEVHKIVHIDVANKAIKSLKGIEYFTSLLSLNCNNNDLTSLDLSENVELMTLYCSNNSLSSLNIKKNISLVTLCCKGNQLKELDLQSNIVLKDLRCSENRLTCLDTSKNVLLEFIGCDNNKIEKIDTNKNVALEVLNCSNNELTMLDFRLNGALYGLTCDHNCFLSLTLSVYRYKLFSAKHQKRTLMIDRKENCIELTKMDPFIQGDNILNIKGASLNGTLLSEFKVGSKITYSYDCGSEYLMNVEIDIMIKEE